MQVSVCIITRDESQKLARCLESLKSLQGLVAEVLVLDTGSSDDSIQVAERLGAKVYQQAWRGDFAWARNYLASQAKCDLVLFLDTDEWVAGVDIPALEALLGQIDLRQTVGRIVRLNLNQTSQTQSLEPRLYLKSYFNFDGKIHEQVNRQGGGPVYYQDIPLVIKHDGYASQELLLAKAQRNLDLLLAELAKQPDDPYLLFQVGKSYYSQKNLELAQKYFEASLKLKPAYSLGYVFNCLECLVLILLATEQVSAAQRWLATYPEYEHDGDYIYLQALSFFVEKNYDFAKKYFNLALKQPIVKVAGRNDFLAHYYLGLVYKEEGALGLAKQHLSLAADKFSPAKEELLQLLQ